MSITVPIVMTILLLSREMRRDWLPRAMNSLFVLWLGASCVLRSDTPTRVFERIPQRETTIHRHQPIAAKVAIGFELRNLLL
jgi:hypothetical protein